MANRTSATGSEPWKIGENPKSADFNSTINNLFLVSERINGLNLIRQLQDRSIVFAGSVQQYEGWAEAYTDADGRLNTVVTGSTTATFSSNKYVGSGASSLGPYVIIEASSLVTGSFAINNCSASSIGTGSWLVTCSTGTDAVRRAQIYKTLFYGTTGSDARIISPYVTSITALRTSTTRDVGKRAYFAQAYHAGPGAYANRYYGTFVNTTTNGSASFWTRVFGTTGNSDETGTDTTAEEINNPTTVDFYVNTATNNTYVRQNNSTTINTVVTTGDQTANGIFLCVGSVTFASDFSGGTNVGTNINFLETYGVPEMTASTYTVPITIVHTLPTGSFTSTPSKAFGIPFIADLVAGSDILFKLTNADSDTGWISCGSNPTLTSFTPFTTAPTTLTVQLTAGSQAIYGFYLRTL